MLIHNAPPHALPVHCSHDICTHEKLSGGAYLRLKCTGFCNKCASGAEKEMCQMARCRNQNIKQPAQPQTAVSASLSQVDRLTGFNLRLKSF